jgi:hypothetical protein
VAESAEQNTECDTTAILRVRKIVCNAQSAFTSTSVQTLLTPAVIADFSLIVPCAMGETWISVVSTPASFM